MMIIRKIHNTRGCSRLPLVTKLIFALTLILAFSNFAVSVASADGVKIGTVVIELTPKNEEILSIWENNWMWSVLDKSHSQKDVIVTYDSLNSALMALDSGKIDEYDVPQMLGEYILASYPNKYEVSCVMRVINNSSFTFGFSDDAKGRELQRKFNEALSALRENNRLNELISNYANYAKFSDNALSKPVVFENFDGAQTITVAVTGDVPPIDFVAPDGNSAGFNAALLSEIARLLRVNIKLVNIESGANVMALTSGRADVFFWMLKEDHVNAPEGILLSDSYYSWNTYVHLRLKK